MVGLRPELVKTIEHLAARWASADTPLLRHAFPLLAEGRAVSSARLAEAAGTTTALATRAIASGRVALDGGGDIFELFGITLETTRHRLHLDAADLFSCCALVAHAAPCLIGQAIDVCSRDPVTGDRIQLDVAPDRLRGFSPDNAVASMIVTDERTILRDAPLHFCQHVHHFVSRESADEFVAGNAGRYIITIPELNAVARGVYSAIWS